MNYSTALRLARELLGSHAQLKPHNGGFRIFVLEGSNRITYGEGATYGEALWDCVTTEEKVAAEARQKYLVSGGGELESKISESAPAGISAEPPLE